MTTPSGLKIKDLPPRPGPHRPIQPPPPPSPLPPRPLGFRRARRHSHVAAAAEQPPSLSLLPAVSREETDTAPPPPPPPPPPPASSRRLSDSDGTSAEPGSLDCLGVAVRGDVFCPRRWRGTCGREATEGHSRPAEMTGHIVSKWLVKSSVNDRSNRWSLTGQIVSPVSSILFISATQNRCGFLGRI